MNDNKKHGGARPGAGRPKGTGSAVTVRELLDAVEARSNGRNYAEILVDDFLSARAADDAQLVFKYHNLILGKVMTTVKRFEIEDHTDNLEAKKLAFAEAIAKFTKTPAP